MSILILVEHDNHVMHESTRHVLSAALQLDKNPVLLVAGHHCATVADQVALLAGVKSVLLADHLCYEHHLAEPISELVKACGQSFTYFLGPSTTFGRNILPRLASLLDVAQLSDVTRVINQETFEHPIYAGNAIETVKMLDEKKVLSIRTTAFDSCEQQNNPADIQRIEYTSTQSNTHFLSHELNKQIRPDLETATIIVAGGRGLQSAEHFKLIEELADALGAAIGASRAAVDAGFISNDFQVGQTGKIVAPTLYFAIGISGAIQHMAGMKDSKVIVAINKDGDAPIFQIANYGLVGDLFVIVPQLIQTLKERGITVC